MAIKIDSAAARERLKPRREPYWSRVRKGCFVGVRKMTADSAGSWIARAVDSDTGKDIFRSLGEFGDLPPGQRFDAAKKTAEVWFAHLGAGGAAEAATVQSACRLYVDHLLDTKGERAAKDAEARLRRHVLGNRKLAALELLELKPAHVETWRKSLRDKPVESGARRGEKRSASALNRDVTALRAVLNHAFACGLIATDFAWRAKLVPVKNADRRREVYLDREQRRAFIEHAAPDVAAFLRGLCMLPLRPGALAALVAGDYDRRLRVLKIGKDKAGEDRRIKLPAATAAAFEEASRGKLPSAPLFGRADGKAFDKDAWKKPVRAAAKAAGLPAGTTAYAIRHSVITDLVHAGLDLATIAQVAGTSVVMIEKFYKHLRGEVAADALARLAL